MKKFLAIFLILCLLVGLTACSSSTHHKKRHSDGIKRPGATTEAPTTEPVFTEPTEPETEPPTTAPPLTPREQVSAAGFDPVYADICRLLSSGDISANYTYTTVGMDEIVMYAKTQSERYRCLSYALEDMDRDGRPEMIILDAEDNARILAIYTIQGGQPVLTAEGWYRSRLYKLSDNSLYEEGSGGAAYSIFENNGHLWFTYPKDENQTQTGYYYAADGSYDPKTAQEISSDEYHAKQDMFQQMITSFTAYYFE